MERRTLIKASVGGLLFLLLGQGTKMLAAQPSPLIRPPGATTDSHFLAACLRCGQCAQACTSGAIVMAGLENGLSIGTPHIVPRTQSCDLCLSCIDVCPSGALAPVVVKDVIMGLADHDRERCETWTGGVCRLCYNICPPEIGAISLNAQGKPIVDPDLCVGCGQCEEICPLLTPAVTVTVQSDQKRR